MPSLVQAEDLSEGAWECASRWVRKPRKGIRACLRRHLIMSTIKLTAEKAGTEVTSCINESTKRDLMHSCGSSSHSTSSWAVQQAAGKMNACRMGIKLGWRSLHVGLKRTQAEK